MSCINKVFAVDSWSPVLCHVAQYMYRQAYNNVNASARVVVVDDDDGDDNEDDYDKGEQKGGGGEYFFTELGQ